MPRFQDANFVDDISNLYLNEQYSDIVFHIDDTQLPGHRMILAQRTPVFSKLFIKENSETRKQAVTLTETPLDAFKQFLKFIYTGVIDFESLEIPVILGILQLAVTYKMKRLEEVTVEHLKSICNADNLCDVFNAAVAYSQDDLIVHCLEHVKTSNFDIVTSESLKMLSVKALSCVLVFLSSKVPDLEIFFACVEWMKANPDEVKNFPDLLKNVNLENITLGTLANAIQQCQLIDVVTVLSIVNQQKEKPRNSFGNVITPASGVRVIADGPLTFFTIPAKGSTLKHNTSNDNENVVIDLARLYMLNNLVMELANGDWGYWIEVSEDNVNWTRIIDYSKYICRSVQRLYFKERPVRYIRIHGTAPFNGTFEISRLEAHYAELPLQFDPETGIVEPSHNVALEENNAVVIQGQNSCGIRNGMLSGCILGLSYHAIGAEPIIVQLPQPYFLESMNLFLRRWSNLVYDYNIEISTDKETWTRIFKAKKQAGFQRITLDRQPVVFIKFTGTYASSAGFFDCQHLECPASTEK
uniref:BTB domain-containing protein n=1 Tax=Panagrellus redivivus TaxID=6233 RepID=A0A7E4VEC2_PANRE